jgi:hypothetical protein
MDSIHNHLLSLSFPFFLYVLRVLRVLRVLCG